MRGLACASSAPWTDDDHLRRHAVLGSMSVCRLCGRRPDLCSYAYRGRLLSCVGPQQRVHRRLGAHDVVQAQVPDQQPLGLPPLVPLQQHQPSCVLLRLAWLGRLRRALCPQLLSLQSQQDGAHALQHGLCRRLHAWRRLQLRGTSQPARLSYGAPFRRPRCRLGAWTDHHQSGLPCQLALRNPAWAPQRACAWFLRLRF